MAETDNKTRTELTRAGKLGFIRHAAVYLAVTAALAALNNYTWTGYQWWLWPAFGWGMGVVSHFVSAFVLCSGALRSRLVEREIGKIDE